MSSERPFITVFRARKVEDANRAEALLRAAGIPVERSRMLGRVEVPMPSIPEDGLQISWLVKAPFDVRNEAEQVLADLLQQADARPPRAWVGPLYMLVLVVFIVALMMQNC